MKVCLLNDSFPPVIDGVANVVMNYADILQKEKLADVLVGTPRYPDTNYGEYPYTVIPYQSFDTTKIVKGYRAGNPLDIEEIADMVEKLYCLTDSPLETGRKSDQHERLQNKYKWHRRRCKIFRR